MKILFVDYIWQPGHVNFNTIHIDALKRSGAEVQLVLYKSMKDLLPYSEKDYALIIPDFLKMKKGHSFLNRIGFIIALLIIRIKIKLSDFDYIYISSFDEITIGIMPLGKKMLLVAHDNAKGFSYKIKRFFLNKLKKRGSYIVFNEHMKNVFNKNNIPNVKIISHGCITPKLTTNKKREDNNYLMVVFQASPKIDNKFLKNNIENPDFIEFIEKNNILLILRNCESENIKTKNIQILNYYLTPDEYNNLMETSDVILLAYPPTFKYQVSGVSFECIAINKNLIIYDNPSLYYCRKYYNYDPVFSDSESLKSLLLKLTKGDCGCIIESNQLEPNYNSIL